MMRQCCSLPVPEFKTKAALLTPTSDSARDVKLLIISLIRTNKFHLLFSVMQSHAIHCVHFVMQKEEKGNVIYLLIAIYLAIYLY